MLIGVREMKGTIVPRIKTSDEIVQSHTIAKDTSKGSGDKNEMTNRSKDGQIGIYIGDDPPEKAPKSPAVSCLGVDISHLSEKVQFAILSGLIMTFFLIYGYTQEWIFRQEGMKPHGW